ncbi:MAG: response regulator, partial [Okeania sp. SIO2D1]|nr:response regulator [Okeania sp. SIO2D1]
TIATTTWVAPEITTDGDANLAQFSQLKILAVDDVQSNLDLLQGYFADTKHQLLLAQNGLKALHLAKLHHPDLVLLDLRMPNLDGREVAYQLKDNKETRDIPIIIITASSKQQDYQNLEPLCASFLRKPVNRYQLVTELKKIFPTVDHDLSIAQPENLPQLEDELTQPVATQKLPELIEKLTREEEQTWPKLCQTMNMPQLREFASRLKEWAREYKCSLLLDYQANLEKQLKQFDLESLPQTMENFPNIKRSLSDLLEESS